MIKLLLCIFLIPSALHAQYKILEMNPPAAKKPLKRQLDRMDAVRMYKFNGHIGETDQAQLAIRDIKSLPKKEQETVKKIVDDENKDRAAIFKAIADYNKLNAKEKEFLKKSAADTYKAISAKGTYYLENKSWQKKY